VAANFLGDALGPLARFVLHLHLEEKTGPAHRALGPPTLILRE
jgi:hypothetical protein